MIPPAVVGGIILIAKPRVLLLNLLPDLFAESLKLVTPFVWSEFQLLCKMSWQETKISHLGSGKTTTAVVEFTINRDFIVFVNYYECFGIRPAAAGNNSCIRIIMYFIVFTGIFIPYFGGECKMVLTKNEFCQNKILNIEQKKLDYFCFVLYL